MTAIWNFGLHAIDTMPAWLAAFLVGWAVSVGITHAFKYMLPVRWNEWLREDMTRSVAVVSGFIPAFLWMGEAGASLLSMSLTGLVTGLWSPTAYALLIAGLRRHPRLAWAADVLSADKRGVLLDHVLAWLARRRNET